MLFNTIAILPRRAAYIYGLCVGLAHHKRREPRLASWELLLGDPRICNTGDVAIFAEVV